MEVLYSSTGVVNYSFVHAERADLKLLIYSLLQCLDVSQTLVIKSHHFEVLELVSVSNLFIVRNKVIINIFVFQGYGHLHIILALDLLLVLVSL